MHTAAFVLEEQSKTENKAMLTVNKISRADKDPVSLSLLCCKKRLLRFHTMHLNVGKYINNI